MEANRLNGMVVKRNPLAECEALRVVVGRVELRPMVAPVYEDRRFVGMRKGADWVAVFRVLGYGSTEKRAFDRMARREDGV